MWWTATDSKRQIRWKIFKNRSSGKKTGARSAEEKKEERRRKKEEKGRKRGEKKRRRELPGTTASTLGNDGIVTSHKLTQLDSESSGTVSSHHRSAQDATSVPVGEGVRVATPALLGSGALSTRGNGDSYQNSPVFAGFRRTFGACGGHYGAQLTEFYILHCHRTLPWSCSPWATA